ncbi:hypothetical protein PEPS_02360 [Persicobacter psychrovividus]|uniref:Uncharacterized protein n=1 Tax=Persicobacter psychrovividus TaxID=387638 RepID=A0ABM7VAN2_9BACT|nr:hypothetical protein PEPS_02360 [Persicobacter psychrovividus]
MEFIEYLRSKNINPNLFEKNDTDKYQLWNQEFSQMHPKSFTMQKLFEINNIRRKFPLTKY